MFLRTLRSNKTIKGSRTCTTGTMDKQLSYIEFLCVGIGCIISLSAWVLHYELRDIKKACRRNRIEMEIATLRIKQIDESLRHINSRLDKVDGRLVNINLQLNPLGDKTE